MTETLEEATRSLWIDIVPEIQEQLGLPRIQAQHIRIWSLVLSSQYIIHRIVRQTRSASILVPSGEAPEAVEQITSFENENVDWQAGWVPPSEAATPTASIAVVVLLGVFHALTIAGMIVSRAVWMSEGSAQAGLIGGGEWWRAITALTLHVDVTHVLSNMVIGGFFVVWLCRELGTGLGWLSILASGILGNLVNALVQSPLHNAVGASTAVFGTIGLLSALRMQTSEEGSKGVLIPLMAGIILMALLGTGGERTDVGAHLFGLLSGLALGAALAVAIRRGYFPSGPAQRRLASVALIVPFLAWAAAFA